MLPCGLISFANCPRHQLEINLITNILSWLIGQLWIHYKILMFTNAPTSRFGFASLWCKEDKAWSILSFYYYYYFYNGLGFTSTQGFHPSEIWACFTNAVYYSFAIRDVFWLHFFFLFFNTRVSLSQAWSCTRDILFGVQAYLSFVRQVSAAIVLLSKHVFSLAARLRITRASCGCHLYKRRWYFMG